MLVARQRGPATVEMTEEVGPLAEGLAAAV
jgi:hypothetical protein